MDLGAEPQAAVPAGTWQSARSESDWRWVGCTVAPGFELAGFELAPQDWRSAAQQHRMATMQILVRDSRMCRRCTFDTGFPQRGGVEFSQCTMVVEAGYRLPSGFGSEIVHN